MKRISDLSNLICFPLAFGAGIMTSILLSACTSVTGHDDFATELVSREAPAPPYRVLQDEKLVTQQTVDAIRAAVPSSGRLLAVAQLPQGFHPFLVVAFVERDGIVDLLMTSVYWGRIQGKYEVSVDLSSARSLVESAKSTFDCRSGPLTEFLFGSTLIYWKDGSQVVCDGGWMTEEGAAFGRQFQPLLDEAVVHYEAP